MILRYCPDPVLVPMCFRTRANSANGANEKVYAQGSKTIFASVLGKWVWFGFE